MKTQLNLAQKTGAHRFFMADWLSGERRRLIATIKGLFFVRRFVVMTMSLLCVFCSGIVVAQQTAAPKPYTGDGGKGITIMVPAPVLQNPSASDTWIPQLFQDTITGDLVRYSAMTVIDRANEQMVLAEQIALASSGIYSDDDYIRIGNLTNAQYIAAGKITKIADSYSVSFRINHIETNEIKTAFDKTYPLKDIETGLAPKEAVRELLAGMGIQLTEAGEKSLLAIQETQVRATAQLAKGMAAEKNGDLVEALAHLIEAREADPTMREASVHIQNFSGTVPAGSIRERAEWALAQKEKWKKIFADLKIYVMEKLPIFIYDFSVVEDAFDAYRNEVVITVSPGIKVVPDRTVLLVWKTIWDNWSQISKMEENKGWTNTDIGAGISYFSFSFQYKIGLYDDYGDHIAGFQWHDNYGKDAPSLRGSNRYSSSYQVLAQHKYYNDTKFSRIRFTVPLNKLTETITPKIERISERYTNGEYPVLTPDEWQEWLASQSEAGN